MSCLIIFTGEEIKNVSSQEDSEDSEEEDMTPPTKQPNKIGSYFNLIIYL